MTISDVTARLHAAANGALPIADLRSAAEEIYGKADAHAVARLVQDARYWRVAVSQNGASRLETPFVTRVRRDYAGPLDLAGVDLSQGLSVVTVEDGPSRWYLAAAGALPTLIYWLAEQMKPKPAAEPEAD
ncbi:MAG TPA: hypothetical protein VGM37_15540 [Armatimonadota bacterium]|jgi:hypothetical protein